MASCDVIPFSKKWLNMRFEYKTRPMVTPAFPEINPAVHAWLGAHLPSFSYVHGFLCVMQDDNDQHVVRPIRLQTCVVLANSLLPIQMIVEVFGENEVLRHNTLDPVTARGTRNLQNLHHIIGHRDELGPVFRQLLAPLGGAEGVTQLLHDLEMERQMPGTLRDHIHGGTYT